MKLGRIALRNIKRNKKRSMLSVIATAIATFAIVFMFGYMEGLELDMKDMAFHYETGEIQIRNKKYDDKIFSLDRAVDNYIGVMDKISMEYPQLELSPRLRFPSTVMKDDRTIVCFGIAVDFDREIKYLGLEEKLIEGVFPTKPREVLMGVGLAEELKLKVGDKFTPITMTRKGASSGITFKVTGLAKFPNGVYTNKTFISPLTDIPAILKMKGAVSEILLKNVGERSWFSTADKLNDLLEETGFHDIEAIPWTEIGLSYGMIQMANISYTIMAIFFFILASSVIANTMLMVVFERRKEIGTITAMGMTDWEVVRLFFLEALCLGIIGAGFGVLLGVVVIIPLSITGMDLSSMGETVDFGTSWMIYPQLTLKSTLVVFLYSVFVASFISFFPSRSAAKVDPVVALRAE